MPLVILTADVQDRATWERAFRTHGELFKTAGIGAVQYTIGTDNHVVMSTDTDDVEAYMDFIKSESTQAAMKNDGVKRETVKVFVLDKEFSG